MRSRVRALFQTLLPRSNIFRSLPLLLLLMGSGFCTAQQAGFSVPATDCPRSQHQADIWYFGEFAGIDFRSGTAVPLTDQHVMTAFKSSSIMSDSNGILQFFSNGQQAWDRAFNPMTGSSFAGDLGVDQSSIIIPVPGYPLEYDLFTVDVMKFQPDNSFTTRGLSYTPFDMSLNNGLGGIASELMNAPLISPVSQKLTAMYNEAEKIYWVLVHQWGTDNFYAYPISKDGLGDPVISAAGTVQTGGFMEQSNALGYMKFSPDGTKVALAISGLNKVELFNFDPHTGVVSGAQSYTFTRPGVSPYGIEFSPDSKKLYTGLLQLTGNGPPAFPSVICQFDLNSGLTAPVAIDSMPGIRSGDLQLATDGRIYIARTVNFVNKKDSLEVIYNPTRPGNACNLNLLNHQPGSRFSLSGRNSIYGLPNVIQSYFNIPVFTYDSSCFGEATQFHITNKANIDQVSWDFGDGAGSSVMDPVHLYAQPGTYKVKLTETFNGINFKDSLPVTIHTLPVVELGDSILLYSGSTINLHAGGGNMEYLWSNGSHDSIISVSDQGDYWVKVRDYNCCVNFDTVYVKVFQYYIPNAFTPNGDGLNDIFRVTGLYRNVRFNMYLYDRWGQLIFHSGDLDTGWDGTYQGKPCPADTYIWMVNIDFLGQDIVTKGSIVLKGSVILLR